MALFEDKLLELPPSSLACLLRPLRMLEFPFSPSPISWRVTYSIGERRFGFPEPPVPFSGIQEAYDFGAPCPQQAIDVPSNFPVHFPGPTKNVSEDCTTNDFANPHYADPDS